MLEVYYGYTGVFYLKYDDEPDKEIALIFENNCAQCIGRSDFDLSMI